MGVIPLNRLCIIFLQFPTTQPPGFFVLKHPTLDFIPQNTKITNFKPHHINKPMIGLETERLKFRQWQESDFDSFAAYFADEEQAKYVGGKKKQGRKPGG